MPDKKRKVRKVKHRKGETMQQKRFAMAAKEASRRVKADPRLDFQVQMRNLLKK